MDSFSVYGTESAYFKQKYTIHFTFTFPSL